MVCEFCEGIAAVFASGNFSESTINSAGGAFAGGLMGFMIGMGILIALIALAAFYVYTSLAWYTIGRKLRYKNSWLAWIPIVRWAMILQLGSFHWAWIFLILIPILGWIALFILIIIASWRIFEKRRYPGWFSLAVIIPKIGGILSMIVIGFVAWKDLKKKLI